MVYIVIWIEIWKSTTTASQRKIVWLWVDRLEVEHESRISFKIRWNERNFQRLIRTNCFDLSLITKYWRFCLGFEKMAWFGWMSHDLGKFWGYNLIYIGHSFTISYSCIAKGNPAQTTFCNFENSKLGRKGCHAGWTPNEKSDCFIYLYNIV